MKILHFSRMELRDHMVIYVYLFKVTVPFYSPISDGGGSCFSCQHLLPVTLTVALLVGVKWCLIVVLFCVSLRTHDVQHLFMCLFISFPYIFFVEMSSQIFCPFGLCFGNGIMVSPFSSKHIHVFELYFFHMCCLGL